MDRGQSNNALSRGAEALFRWFFTVGQTVFLRSTQSAIEGQLRARAYPKTSADYEPNVIDREPVQEASNREWAEWLREEMAPTEDRPEGVSRCELPFEREVTARPTAETRPSPSADIDDRDWSRVSVASSMLKRMNRVDPRCEPVLREMYGDKGLEWPYAGFRHGALYRFDENAIRLLGRLRKHDDARLDKLRAKKIPSGRLVPQTDLQLMRAESERATAMGADDPGALLELERLESTAEQLLSHVAGIFVALGGETEVDRLLVEKRGGVSS